MKAVFLSAFDYLRRCSTVLVQLGPLEIMAASAAVCIYAGVGAVASFLTLCTAVYAKLYAGSPRMLLLCVAAMGLGVGLGSVTQGRLRVSGTADLALPDAAVRGSDIVLTADPWRRSDGRWSGRGQIIRLHADWARVEGAYPVILAGEALAEYAWGDHLHVPSSPVRTGVDGEGVFFLRVEGETSLEGAPVVLRTRHRIHRRVQERSASWEPKVRGVFMALFLGTRDELSPFLYDQVRRAGAAHVLALSGMHLGLVAAAFLLLVSPLRSRVLSMAGVSLLSLTYLVLAGLRPSLVRAVIMLHGALLFRIRDGHVHGLRVLCFTFLIHALIFPRDTQSLGFILSFSALAGLFTLSPLLMPLLATERRQKLRAGVCAGLGAQLATSVVAWRQFGTVYPLGAVSSLVFTPLAAVAIAAGLAALLPTGILSLAGLRVLETCVRAFVVLSEHFAVIPGISDGVLLAIWLLVPVFLLFLLAFRYYLASRRIPHAKQRFRFKRILRTTRQLARRDTKLSAE